MILEVKEQNAMTHYTNVGNVGLGHTAAPTYYVGIASCVSLTLISKDDTQPSCVPIVNRKYIRNVIYT